MPLLVIACTCSPAMPAYTSWTCAPAIRSASCIALRIERVVSSMSDTTPRRMPVVRAWPTPSTLIVGCLGRSPSTSAMMAVVFADPMSSPATRRSGFMAVWRSLGHGNEDRSRSREAASASRSPSTGAMSARRSSVTSCIARTGQCLELEYDVVDVPARRTALTRAYNAGIRGAHRAEQPQQRRIALHQHRRVDGDAGRIDRQRDPSLIVHAKTARRRHQRHGHSFRDSTTSVPGSFRSMTTRSNLGMASPRAHRAGRSDPRPTPMYRRASELRMSLGAT